MHRRPESCPEMQLLPSAFPLTLHGFSGNLQEALPPARQGATQSAKAAAWAYPAQPESCGADRSLHQKERKLNNV